ncbi:MAG: hypothetical protein OEY14_13335 [Myxococcales bacterium]|nr:hypothetical protein [Myxococcales bacterium]
MTEKTNEEIEDESTVENRVYVFRELAAAWLASNPGLLSDPATRAQAMGALADLAFVSCVISDEDELEAPELAERIREGV